MNFAEDKNIPLIQLKRPRLQRDVLEENITKQNPSLLLFNAHGDETTIYGDKIGTEAADIFVHLSKKNILHLLGKQDEPGAMASAMLLWNNLLAQEVLGNGEMKYS